MGKLHNEEKLRMGFYFFVKRFWCNEINESDMKIRE